MAKPNVVVRQREQKWWMEESEEDASTYANRLQEESKPKTAQKPLKEKYDTGRFQPGWNGKDAPAVEKMGSGYATKGDRNFSDLGASSGKKTSKGSVGKVTIDDVKEAKRIIALAQKQALTEELLDDEFEDDMAPEQNGPGPDEADGFDDQFGGEEGLGDEGLNGEGDVPPEMGGDEGFEGGDGDVASQVTVNIGGQEYTLEPAEDELGGDEGFEGDMGGAEGGFDDAGLEGQDGFDGGDDFGAEGGDAGGAGGFEDEGAGDDELARHGGVKAERKDITQEKRMKEGKKDKYDQLLDRAIQEARKPKKISKAQLIKHHLTIKSMSERNLKIANKKLFELFTGEYVLNKQGEPGYDFSPVGGDESFAVVARAASGDQYSPTISKSIWEPDKKGGKTAHAKTVTEDFKDWVKAMKKNLDESESDPGEDSDHFNKNDLLDKNLSSTGGLDNYPALPELIGKDDETISQYGEAQKRVRARQQKVTESEQAIQFPSKEVKEDLEKNLKESTGRFDFKKLVNGEY